MATGSSKDGTDEELTRAVADALRDGSPLVEQIVDGIIETKAAQFTYARDVLPVHAAIARRRDWMSFTLRAIFLAGSIATIVLLLLRERIAEALQVFALVAGYFLGFADRGQSTNQPAQHPANGKAQ